MRFGSLEAGGTKMVMGILNENMQILRSTTCLTRTPEETMPDILDFFEGEHLDAVGIATFGPVNLNENSSEYGNITSTPKLAWRNFPLYRTMVDTLKVPCLVDTDVNAAALAEATYGARNLITAYITVGTGIGNGLLCEIACTRYTPPRVGTYTPIRHRDDPSTGAAPYHTLCLEGLASGLAYRTAESTAMNCRRP